MRQIQFCKTDQQILATFSIMRQLHPNLEDQDYLRKVRLCQAEVGLQLAALDEDGQVICVAGFRLCRNLGWGKYLYVDNLVTDEKLRSKRFGEKMFDWLVDYARRHECAELRLDSAADRHSAHRFYIRKGMDNDFSHFRLTIKPSGGTSSL